MAIEFAEVSSGGKFFKPDDHKDATAFLIEVERFARQVPTNYGPKDTAVATLSIFPNASALAGGSPAVVNACQIQQSILARDLEPLVGKATIVKLEVAPPSKPGQKGAWVWRPVDAETRDAVVAYVTKREAEVDAAKADAPSFG